MPEFVRVRDCACPETPHAEEGDGVFLRDTLSAIGGMSAEQRLVSGEFKTDNDIIVGLLPDFVRSEVTGANYEPFTVDDLLADWRLARPVCIRAGELYLESVVTPLAPEPPRRSRTGRTRATTSPTPSPTG